MNKPWLYPLSIVTAVCTLVVIVLGAIVAGLERPIAVNPTAAMLAAAAPIQLSHHIIAGIAIVLMLIVAIGASSQIAWAGFAAALAGGILGAKAITQAVPELSGVLHAVLAQIFFASIIAVLIMTSKAWRPDFVDDTWKPSMRSLATAVPLVILLQVTLGACYRYRVLGVIWHILDAMIVLLLALCVAVFLVRQLPDHPTLRPAAITLGVITAIQVLLGFTAFMMLILFPESGLPVVITGVLHVTNGALTFGAAAALSVLIRHNVRQPVAVAGHQPVSDRL